MLVGWPAQLAASAFNQLGQYANRSGHRAYCMQNSPFLSFTIASTQHAYPWRDGQAGLAWA